MTQVIGGDGACPARGGRSPHRLRRNRLRAALALTATLVPLVAAGTANAAATAGQCPVNDRFGRMLPALAAAPNSVADLTALGKATTELNHLETVRGTESDDESDIPAGYTYAGQFIDHDITLDPRPDDLTTIVDPATLRNVRTPSLDLDSVYGAGPAGSPQLYEADGYSLKLGRPLSGAVTDPGARDVLRDGAGRAVLGDDRNDENRIVGSLHSIFTRYHNRKAAQIRAANPSWSASQVFAAARRQVTWSYQWAVVNDFLPQMSSQAAVASVALRGPSSWTVNLNLYDTCKGSMPVEFSTAAYRWHTMVRNDYVVNDRVKDLPIFDGTFDPTRNLAGFQPAPSNFGFDWDLLFKMTERTPQMAYKLDNSLVPALGILPGGGAGTGPIDLSVRNLLRGRQLGLPSGQAVARAMGLTPLRDDQIVVGPALSVGAPVKALTAVSPAFAGNAPLWSYLFAESVNQSFVVFGGRIIGGDTKRLRLGPVGSRMVNETFVGLLKADPDSILNNPQFSLPTSFGFDDIVREATGMPARRPAKVATASSSLQLIDWNLNKVIDGETVSRPLVSMGWSSTNSLLLAAHTEWVQVDTGLNGPAGAVVLHPRSDGLNAGYGFPVDFTIQVSADGATWTTVTSRTGYARPAAAPQRFTFPQQTVRYVRVTGTRLRSNPWDLGFHRMQFAEVEVTA